MPFQKGVITNPLGRPKNPAEIRELQASAKLEVIEAINSALVLTPEQLKAKLAQPGATMAQHLVGSIISKAIKDGCFMRAQFLINYVLGRPKIFNPEDIPDNGDGPAPTASEVLKGVPSSILLEMVKHANGTATVSREP